MKCLYNVNHAVTINNEEIDMIIKKVDRLKYLKLMIRKYSHRRYETGFKLSDRMYGWIDEYNKIKEAFPLEWECFCKETNSCVTHVGHDLFA